MANRKRLLSASALLLLLSVAACSQIHGGPTGYKQIDPIWGSAYGYRDKQIGTDEFSVFAVGNPKSDAARVAEIALLRAAHLTLEHDRNHFVVVKQKAKAVSQDELISVPVVLPGIFLPVPVASKPTEERVAILIVRLLPRGQAVPPHGLDASTIVTHLSPRLDAD